MRNKIKKLFSWIHPEVKQFQLQRNYFQRLLLRLEDTGLFKKTINALYNNFVAKVFSMDPTQLVEEMKFYLFSTNYVSIVEQTRAVPKRNLDGDQKKLLLDVIHKMDC